MRHIARNVLAATLVALLCVGGGQGCQPDEQGPSHDRAFSDKGLLRAQADQLRSTLVTAHTEVPIRPDQNVLWCGTFQLAWNEACALAGGQLHFLPPEPPDAAILNRKSFDSASLDEQSYVALAGYVRDALAGYVRDALAGRINTRLHQKFAGQAAPTLPTSFVGQRPQDIVAYSYLFKNLEFPVPYERGAAPTPFGDGSVICFGMGPEYKPGRGPMARQTLIHNYVNEDNFVIELETKSPGDRLVLAKVTPEATLAQTITAVHHRIDAAPTSADPADVLIVPKANFDITRRYDELTGRRLLPTAPGMADDLTLLVALQNIRFQMDEQGVRLKSESIMHFGCSAPSRPQPKHQMIFDKPFLITLSRQGANRPYFALWVANPELLVHAR